MPSPHRIALTCALFTVSWVIAAVGGDAPPTHWGFQPPTRTDPPRVRAEGWASNAIDAFILARLESAGLSPSPRADRRTLIRRAYLDLLGLPPTFEAAERFAADEDPLAYERLIDELLASPHYGERWARYWLDLARYADTKGYVYANREERAFVHAHAYRDWVVRALNEDMPYDRFLTLQIAADLIPEGQPDSLAAMGFLTVGRRFLGVIPDIIDDRIDVLTRTTQGLTVSCARCHDHKFDPIPTADYYSLYGVLSATTERLVSLESDPPRTDAYLAYAKELESREKKLHDRLEAKRAELEARLRRQAGAYLAAVPTAPSLPTDDFYEIRGPDDLVPTVVRAWAAYLNRRTGAFDPIFEPWHATATLSPEAFTAEAPPRIERCLNHEGQSLNPLLQEALLSAPPRSIGDLAGVYARLFDRVEAAWAAKRKADPAAASLDDPDLEALRRVLYDEDSPTRVPDGHINEIEWYFDEGSRVELDTLAADIERWIINAPGAPPHAVALHDRADPPAPRIFLRGNQAAPGPSVPRRYLELIEGERRTPYTHGSGRLEMARAIASPDNPLTARVMVNRIWAHHFGRGLVDTPSDFGTRAARPTHPRLLDHLALRFIEEGWSLKKLHRLIMLSSTYTQRSDTPATRAPADPGNALLWRMNPRRLDFEALRDALLAVTAELDPTLGGRPVRMFDGADSPRRTLYGLVDRQFLPGVLRVFDFANPDLHAPQRSTTTVPQQSLFLMNSDFIVRRARALAARPDVRSIADPAQRIARLYELTYQRRPTTREVARAQDFLRDADTLPPPPPPRTVDQTAWRYGYGHVDEAMQRIDAFTELPAFVTDAWQGGPSWPDGALGWVRLTATGGHTGNDLQHAAIRRWIAPRDATVRVSGQIVHDKPAGDGTRFRIVSSRHGLLGQWKLRNQSAAADITGIEVRAGDTLDFVADMIAELNNDDFNWAPVIQAESGEPGRWSAAEEFTGPPAAAPLDAWEQLAQVLLLGNELIFVD